MHIPHQKKEMAPNYINYCLENPLHFIFNPLHSSTNREQLPCNQNSHYKKYGRFLLQKETITCYHQITVRKDGRDTKKSPCMKNVFYVQWYAKRHLLG